MSRQYHTDQPDTGDEPEDDESSEAVVSTIEVRMDDLITELERDARRDRRDMSARRRLEELMEERRHRKDLEDFDDYEV